MQSKFWDDITSRIEASDDLPDVPTPSDIGGSEALEQSTVGWRSKGVVTFPSAGFSQYMNLAQGIAGSPTNILYGWHHNSTDRFDFTIGAFSNNAATATRGSNTAWNETVWGETSAANGTYFLTFAIAGDAGNRQLDVYRHAFSDESRRGRRTTLCPLPTGRGVLTSTTASSGTLYMVNANCPTKLLAYTLNLDTLVATANTADDITLVSGAGTTELWEAQLLTDGTHIWYAGINSSNTQRAQGFAYNISTGARASARDFDYTDTVHLSRMAMNTSGDIFILRARTSADIGEVTNTARVLEYQDAVAPSWCTIPNQTATQNQAFSIDVSTYISGTPTPTVAVTSGRNLPSWLSLCGTTLSGTPTSSASAQTIYLTASNSAGSANTTFSITVASSASAPRWCAIPAQTATQNQAFSLDVSTYLSGSPTPSVSVSGNPTWLTLSGTTLSGTPTATASAVTVTLSATNSAGTATRNFSLTVQAAAVTTGGWRSKGVVTWPLNEQFRAGAHISTFNRATRFAQELPTTPANKIYGWVLDPEHPPNTFSRDRFEYSISAFTDGAATGTLESHTCHSSWVSGYGAQTGTVDASRFYSFRTDGTTYYFRVANLDGSAIRSRGHEGSFTLSPNPSGIATAVSGTRAYVLDSECTPTKLLAYTMNIMTTGGHSHTLCADTTNDITLASGAGTQSLVNRVLMTDGTYIWIAGRHATTKTRVLAYCYQISTGTRVTARDIDYTDTVNLGRFAIVANGDVWLFRATAHPTLAMHQYADEWIDPNARVLEYVESTTATAPSWCTIPAQEARTGASFSLDVSTYLSGAPTPTVSVTSGQSLPSWLSLSGTTLSGTPTVAAAATTIYLTATNSQGAANTTFNLSVLEALTSPSGTIPNQTAVEGSAFSLNLASHITGNPAPTFTVSGLNGTGLSFSGTTISGTPSLSNARAAAFQITVMARNSQGTLCRTFNLNINAAARWSAVPNQTATVGQAFSLILSGYVTAFPSATISIRQGTTIPSWLSYCQSNSTLSGTPTASAGATTVQFTASNGVGSSVHVSFTIAVQAAPTSPSWSGDFDDAVQVGTSLSWNVSGLLSGNPTPTVAFRSGWTKPTWLTLSGTTLGGTPPSASYPSDTSLRIRLTATNSAGSTHQDLTLWITRSAPATPTGTIPNQTATVGQAFSLNLASHVSGVPNPSFSVTGLSGTGLSLRGTRLRGTPSTSHVGTHNITVTATNAKGFLCQTFSFTVSSSLPTGTIPAQTAVVGTAFSLNLASHITGTPNPTFSVCGLSGTGLSFSGSTISGTPALQNARAAAYPISVTATNASGDITRTFNLTVNASARWSAIPNQNATVGTAFSLILSGYVTAFPAATISIRQGTTLPSWLTYCETNSTLSGTPTQAGTSTLQFTASNGVGTAVHTSFTITVASSTVAPTGTIPNQTATVGQAFSLNLASHITGTPNPTFSATGLSAAGLSLSGTTISGTPQASHIGTHSISVTATNSAGNITRTFNIVVSAATSAPTGSICPQTATAGTAFSLNLATLITGSPAPSFSDPTNSLSRTGLSLSGTTISGTPARGNARTRPYPISITATNSAGVVAFRFSLTIRSAPQWTNIPNQQHTVNTLFSTDLSAYVSGYPTPTIAVKAGTTLPDWLTLSCTTISGTPTATAAAVTVQFTATNAAGSTDTSFTIAVVAATVAPSGTIPAQTATADTAFSLNLASHITGSPNPTFSILSDSLAGTGLSLSGSTISGTPSRSQASATAYRVSIQAQNSEGTITRTFDLTIRTRPQWTTVPNQQINTNQLLSLDLATYVDSIPASTISIKSGTSLPAWLTLSGTTISGTPTEAACPVTVQFTATNAAGSTDTSFDITVGAPAVAPVQAGANVRVIPLTNRIEKRNEAQPAFLVEFDEDVELPDGDALQDNIPEWLDIFGVALPDSAITVRAQEARTIIAVNAPCDMQRFAFGATFTLRVQVSPKLETAPTTSDFTVTGGTLTSVTEQGVGRLYDLLITFPSSGQGTTSVIARASAFDGVNSNITLMTCLYGMANLRTANFPTGVQPESTSVTFDILAEPALTSTPTISAISVSAGSVTSLCEIRENLQYRATIALPAGTGTVTVTALASGWTNISANQTLGTIQYRAV